MSCGKLRVISHLSLDKFPEKWKGPDSASSFNAPPHEMPSAAELSPFFRFAVAPVTPILTLAPFRPMVTPSLTVEIAFLTASIRSLSEFVDGAPVAGGAGGPMVDGLISSPGALKVAHWTTTWRIASSEIGLMP